MNFPFSVLSLAISAISANCAISKICAEIAEIALCAHTFQQLQSLIINGLKNKTLHPTDFLQTHSQSPQNVRRNPFQNPFSLKINTPLLITQYDIISIIGIFNNFKMPIMPKMPHVFVYSRLSYFLKKFSYAEGLRNSAWDIIIL